MVHLLINSATSGDHRKPVLAARVKPVLDWVSDLGLVLLVLLVAAANIDKILLVFGTRGILAVFLLIALGFGIGGMLGGPGTDTRRVLALGRDSATLPPHSWSPVRASGDPQVVLMVIVVTIVVC
jgi:BASS family bile acid:Na+ symporter